MIAKSGPTSLRTPAIVSTIRESGMSRPECAYGPVIRISSLAARKPSPLAHAAWSTRVWLNSSKSPSAFGSSEA